MDVSEEGTVYKGGGLLKFKRADLEGWLEKSTHEEEKFDILDEE